MSSEVQPQPGDKVRVTIEDVVRENGTYEGHWRVEDGRASVEIVERADDPSRDPIGQWRAVHGTHLYRKGRKGDSTVWRDVQTGEEFSDDYVRNFPRVQIAVTGAVPGTPAAQAQQGGRDTEDAHACMEPIRAAFGTPTHCRRPAGHLGNHSPVRSVEDWREVVGP